jgi:hypothetical protein
VEQAAQRLFGYSQEEAVAQAITIIIPPELHNEKDGRYLDVSLTISPVRDAEGTLIGASKIQRRHGKEAV